MKAARNAGHYDVKCPCCGKPLDVENSDIRQNPNGGWPDVTATGCPECGGGIRVWMNGVMSFSIAAATTTPARSHTQASGGKTRGKVR